MRPVQSPDEAREAIATVFIGRRRVMYESDGQNPIHAWLAYRVARYLRVPIPDWVLEFLDGAAKAISSPGINRKEAAKAVGLSARGKGGRGTPSKRAKTHERKQAIVTMVQLFQRDGMLDELAWAEVGHRNGLSTLRVRNIYYELTDQRPKSISQTRRVSGKS